MKRIGCFQKQGDGFSGVITLLHTQVRARITPAPEKPSADAPDYILAQEGDFAHELGLAWRKQTREEQLPYIKIKLDDPLFPQPIHAVLWETRNGEYDLLWDRAMSGGDAPERQLLEHDFKIVAGAFRSIQRLATDRIEELFPELAFG